MKHSFTERIIHIMRKKLSKLSHINIQALTEAINSEELHQSIDAIVNDNDYSSKRVLEVYELIFEPQEIGFLEQVYNYTIFLSFPDAVDMTFELHDKYECYLTLLSIFNEMQKCSEDQTFMSVYPFELLRNEEIVALESPDEYIRFSKAFKRKYVYEMMKLNHELQGRSTIEHILGVHHLALKIARQLKEKDISVDLGRVSGAAAGHDIGKFGCRPEEIKKIAYYHYYYTDIWFQSLDIHYIKNVAVYHSTWDLELESLSLESLILIFSDFCVKRSKEKEGLFMMKFLTVEEAFDTILNKLDNVDARKRRRYEKVYLKLKNFHDYLVYHGVNCTESNYTGVPFKEIDQVNSKTYSSLDHGNDVVDHLKIKAIDSSIHLMCELRDINSLNQILFKAKGEKDVLMLRRYLYIFEEYSIYLTPEQKIVTLKFLTYYMIHREEDIRTVSSKLIGRLLADYDENYTKELPPRAKVTYSVAKKFEAYKQLMNRFFFEDLHLTPVKRNRQVMSYYLMIESLLSHVDEQFKKQVIQCIRGYYRHDLDAFGNQFLLEVIDLLPEDIYDEKWLNIFVSKQLDGPNKMLAYKRLNLLSSNVIVHDESLPFYHGIRYMLDKEYLVMNEQVKSNMYLSNLKSATTKEIKEAQIELLFKYAKSGHEEDRFYLAMHCCNLLKVSEYEQVRSKAGNTLVLLYDDLSFEEKNDIVVELVRALEIEGYGFTRHIPRFLGQLIPKFGNKEYDEIIVDLDEKVSSASTHIRTLVIDTFGTMILKFLELNEYNKVETLLGLVFKGFYSNKLLVMQMAFKVLSKDIIGNTSLRLEKRFKVFNLVYRKLNCFLLDSDFDDLFIHSVGLHYIYQFLTDYEHKYKGMSFDKRRDVAVYMGTFDPFSLGQKLAVEAANDKGFDVYIGISEFKWQRRTQPSLMRKKVVDMSIANRLTIFTLPQTKPINLNKTVHCDLLRAMFPEKDVHLIIGEEALLYMAEYKMNNEGVYGFPHIVFQRQHVKQKFRAKQEIEEKLSWLPSYDMCVLPDVYDKIDPDKIRMNIDENYDPYDVIDVMASQYIKANKMYRNEPQYKSVVPISDMAIQIVPLDQEKALYDICSSCQLNGDLIKGLASANQYPRRMMMKIIEASTSKLLGFSIFAHGDPNTLKPEIKNVDVIKRLDASSCKKILIIDAMGFIPQKDVPALNQIILTETVMYAIKNHCTYGIYTCEHQLSEALITVIQNSGFEAFPCDYTGQDLLAVDMSDPIVLNLDGTTRMKSDYRSNEFIRSTIRQVRQGIQKALCKLYPGQLVVSFDRSMLYNHLIRLIAYYNDVSIKQDDQFGERICVPYGEIFKRWLLPNSITKSFHTERYYDDTFLKYHVKAYPGYLSIDNQTDVLKAFDQPIMLIDDLIDKGLRLMAIYNQLIEKDITVDRVIAGIISSRGEKLLSEKGLNVASAYYFPKFKAWFNEADLYPFIGGDSVDHVNEMSGNGLSSINLMLPFVYPKYIKDTSKDAVYQLSVTCLENAITIMEAVEQTYLNLNNRPLTIERLKEVMVTPRIPYVGDHVLVNELEKPSKHLHHQLNHLLKIKAMYH